MKEIAPDTKCTFAILCPPSREEEARDLLAEVEGVAVLKGSKRVMRAIPNEQGKLGLLEGQEVSGVCQAGHIAVLTRLLGTKGISAFSRQTQILCNFSDLYVGAYERLLAEEARRGPAWDL